MPTSKGRLETKRSWVVSRVGRLAPSRWERERKRFKPASCIITDAGKRPRQAHKTGQTLAQRGVPPLHVGGFSPLFVPLPKSRFYSRTDRTVARRLAHTR